MTETDHGAQIGLDTEGRLRQPFGGRLIEELEFEHLKRRIWADLDFLPEHGSDLISIGSVRGDSLQKSTDEGASGRGRVCRQVILHALNAVVGALKVN